MVYIESLYVNEIFGKVGDTLIIKGIDYGKDSIEIVKIILKADFGTYEAIFKYQSSTELQKFCYEGDKNSFELMSNPAYNEKGEIIGNKAMKTWKPNKLSNCN